MTWIRCHGNVSLSSLDALLELQRNHALAWWIEPGRVLVAWPAGGAGWLCVEEKSVLDAVVAAREGRGGPLGGALDPPTMLILLRESIERARVDPAGGGR